MATKGELGAASTSGVGFPNEIGANLLNTSTPLFQDKGAPFASVALLSAQYPAASNSGKTAMVGGVMYYSNGTNWIAMSGSGLAGSFTSGTSALPLTGGKFTADATSGNVILNLPAATNTLLYSIKRIDQTANTVTLNRAGSDLIDGLTSLSFSALAAYDIQSNGSTAWWIF